MTFIQENPKNNEQNFLFARHFFDGMEPVVSLAQLVCEPKPMSLSRQFKQGKRGTDCLLF